MCVQWQVHNNNGVPYEWMDFHVRILSIMKYKRLYKWYSCGLKITKVCFFCDYVYDENCWTSISSFPNKLHKIFSELSWHISCYCLGQPKRLFLSKDLWEYLVFPIPNMSESWLHFWSTTQCLMHFISSE